MRLGVRLSCCCCTCAAACTPSTPLEHSWCTRRGLTLLATLDAGFSMRPRNNSSDNAGGCLWSALHLRVPGQIAPAADRARCCPTRPYVPQNCLQRKKDRGENSHLNLLFTTVNCWIDTAYRIDRKLYEFSKCNNSRLFRRHTNFGNNKARFCCREIKKLKKEEEKETWKVWHFAWLSRNVIIISLKNVAAKSTRHLQKRTTEIILVVLWSCVNVIYAGLCVTDL